MYLILYLFIFLDKFSIMEKQNAMTSQGYNNMRPGFSNNQMQSQRRFNVKVDKTIGPVILRYDKV